MIRALEAIARVGLIDHALRRADQLSGGQQQRVGIARALVQSPRMLLADEPIASLDPRTADDLMGLLHAICKADGLAAIVSLHQLDFARRYADRIVALARGAVVFDGPPADLGSREIEAIYGAGQPALKPLWKWSLQHENGNKPPRFSCRRRIRPRPRIVRHGDGANARSHAPARGPAARRKRRDDHFERPTPEGASRKGAG
jgi:phosphonate transport system ATP-binding protein